MLGIEPIKNVYFKWSRDDDLISGVKPKDHYVDTIFIDCAFHPNVYNHTIFDNCTFINCDIEEDQIITSESLLAS